MDASHSPSPSREGTDNPAGENGETPPDDPHQSFFKALIRRAGEAFSGGNGDHPFALQEGLGPAFEASTPAERAMVINILRMRDLRIADVMTPRADIVAVSEEASLPEVMQAFQSGSFSRMPVYRETLDDPIGFVHLKDMALRYGVGYVRETTEFDLKAHLHAALFVPPSMRIAALLQKMQAERIHMALVIDEFGGVDGLVTIEDLVEAIVGDIEDEHDAEELAQWREEAPGVYRLDARADIREFEEVEEVRLLPDDWEEDVETMGGLVFMLSGRVPARGEVIAHPMGHEFEILEADPRRIKRLRLSLHRALAAGTPLPEAAE